MKLVTSIRHVVTLGCLLWLTAFNALAQNEINGVRVWPSPDSTRIVFDLKDEAKYSYFSLQGPDRLVVDFRDTAGKIDLKKISNDSSLVKRIRYSKPKNKNSLRVVLELNKSIKPVLFVLKPTSPYGDRLVVDLIDQDKRQAILPERLQGRRDVLIAIDAGHGGEDPGSIGAAGSYEKRVTLAISKRLAKLFNAEYGMKAVMVRTNDYYIHPNRRSEIARNRKADFFVSIHADAFINAKPKGASVWVLSLKRANTEIGKWMERTEKHSQLLGGAAEVLKDTNNEKYLARALLDMSMEHSMSTGYEIALEAIKEMAKVTKMHKKAPQSASLAVLKSPDIPSILVEVGFISNVKEEKLLNSSTHQQNLAKAIKRAVHNYFKKNPPEGSLMAQVRIRKHTVRSGESLSILAKRYAVSVNRIKTYNNLTGNLVRVGQVIEIPSS